MSTAWRSQQLNDGSSDNKNAYGNPRNTLIIINNILFSAVQSLLHCSTVCCTRPRNARCW